MKITLEATGTIESVNGVECRRWNGKTESGIELHAWIALVSVHKDADQAQFERDLRAVKVERRLTSFDMRML